MRPFTKLQEEELKTAVHQALRHWNKPEVERQLLSLYLMQDMLAESTLSPHEAIKQLLLDCLEALEAQDELAAKVLFSRFVQGKTLVAVGHETEIGEFAVSRVQSAGIKQLTAILCEREAAMRYLLSRSLEANLPPASYEQLFGFDDAQERLLQQLLRTDGAWLLAASGIGGIGKTALADSVTRRALRALRFQRVYWVRHEVHSMSGARAMPKLAYDQALHELVRQMQLNDSNKTMPAERESLVRARLKEEPSLVIIDNLEEEADVSYLLPRLRQLAEPSKFLLTTRSRPQGEQTIFCQPLTELSLTDAAALLRFHAECSGLEQLRAVTRADMDLIYGVTGGNPLALKLVVGLADRFSLAIILDDLAHGHIDQTDQMYRRIYQSAWNALSEDAQTLLQIMPLVSRATGGALTQLQEVSKLSPERLRRAVDELTKRNLLEARGTFKQQRYGIHRLTETFLNDIVNQWEMEAI
ncbi:MAG: hypothetical protein KC418_14990 [Anaerolineales bacterium]|nr:hypothetical protein [Anaerolineales bacterium]MCB8954530.1 hypothetical protein [Ardenticatenales bacterium]